MLVAVYDIKNCGPRHRYNANGKLVHNSDSINLQNLSSRGTSAGKIKKSIEARDGEVVIDADSSQIEARVLAWLAGQWDLVQAFENREDVYKLTAMGIYGVKLEEVTDEQRFFGKTVILGGGYGLGYKKYKVMVAKQGKSITDERAEQDIRMYRTRYAKIPQLWRLAQGALDAMLSDSYYEFGEGTVLQVHGRKGILMPDGLYMEYPNLRKEFNKEDNKWEYVYDSKTGRNRIYGGKVIENVCQRLARVIIGLQGLRIAKRYPVVLSVHDANATVVPEAIKDEARLYVVECMRWRPKWAARLPLDCESGMGKSYGDSSKKQKHA
jgi:DNA polymerase family A